MSDIAIRVESLGKLYKIGARQERYRTLRDTLSDVAAAPFRRLKNFADNNGKNPPSAIRHPHSDVIWALKDVSFEVKRGEVVGIIGRNGAGKTTLLKILSRITEPAEGSALIRGRVGCLLEVGTGFHPELTGRENIYLNGAILGMKRREIERKFDEIVAFAEIEKFIETPVKHYSSGMAIRLAFAVAAHLEPEILLVDEVLAVGDAAFQKKCLGKIGEVAREGRTVLFVSHNMGAVRNLCDRGIWLDKGIIFRDGDSNEVVTQYLESILDSSGHGFIHLGDRTDREGDGKVRLTSFVARLARGNGNDLPRTGEDMELILGYRTLNGNPIGSLTVAIEIKNAQGYPLIYLGNRYEGTQLVNLPPEGQLVCRVPVAPLRPGRYYATVSCVANGICADKIRDAVVFQVLEGDYFGTGALPPEKHSSLLVTHHWSYREDAKSSSNTPPSVRGSQCEPCPSEATRRNQPPC